MKHSANRTKGYTLIELMVVVGIISLLLGLGINGLDYLVQWNKLNTATALLSSELKNTQSRAFYTNNNLYFYPNSVPSMGGTITLKNKRGKILYVIMTPVTARVRVSPNPPENW